MITVNQLFDMVKDTGIIIDSINVTSNIPTYMKDDLWDKTKVDVVSLIDPRSMHLNVVSIDCTPTDIVGTTQACIKDLNIFSGVTHHIKIVKKGVSVIDFNSVEAIYHMTDVIQAIPVKISLEYEKDGFIVVTAEMLV